MSEVPRKRRILVFIVAYNAERTIRDVIQRIPAALAEHETEILIIDDSSHDQTFEQASEVAKQFGEKFAAKLGELSPGKWEGPVESGYGAHLVFVSERTEGRVPELAEVRDDVRREWANAQRLELNEKFYQELSKRYSVTIESPNTSGLMKPMKCANSEPATEA